MAKLIENDETQSKHSYDEALVDELRRDPQFAAEYLRAALEDEDAPRVLLLALRHVAEARGTKATE